MNELHIDKTNWKKYRFDEIGQNISERVEPSQTDLGLYIGLEHIDPDTAFEPTRTSKRCGRHQVALLQGRHHFWSPRAYQRKTALATTDDNC